METDWQDFLRARGVAAGDAVDGDALAAAATSAVLCDLSHLAVLGFEGADAQSFLQGQLTCDVREATAATSRPGALCTPKGRAIATFRLWQDAAGYCMQLPAARLEPIRKRLSMYVLRSKVVLRDRSGERVRLGIAGPQSAPRLAAGFGVETSALPGPGAISHHGAVAVLGLDGGRFELLVPPEVAPDLWTALAVESRPAGEAAWRWASIRAGEASLHEATQDQFVPQMIDLDLSGGIGFSKGCYTGQEVVARTQYLGRLKQRLYRCHLAHPVDVAAALPAPGTPLYTADLEGQSTGMVVEAAVAPGGGIDLLAVLRIDSASSHPVHVQAVDGPLLDTVAPVHPEAIRPTDG